MLGYGLYAAGAGVIDIFGTAPLEIWANLTSIIFGVALIVAAPLVRLTVPGGLALAIGAMLGLQSIALHDSAHLYGRVIVSIQILRGAFAAVLVLVAYLGERRGSDEWHGAPGSAT